MGNRRKGGWERVGFSPYPLPVPGMKRTHQEGVLKNRAYRSRQFAVRPENTRGHSKGASAGHFFPAVKYLLA